jgi:hypothetical protein
MTTERMAELDERDHQLEQRIAELRDELAAVWDLLLIPERCSPSGSAFCTCCSRPWSTTAPRASSSWRYLRRTIARNQAAEAAIIGQPGIP